jgi:hypothetical protein
MYALQQQPVKSRSKLMRCHLFLDRCGCGTRKMKFDPRKVIALGFLLTSVSMFWMTRISPDVDFTNAVWTRVFQVVGLPLIHPDHYTRLSEGALQR